MLRTVTLIILFSWLSGMPPDHQEPPGYHFKARNLQPEDFGIEASTWDKATSLLDDQVEQSPDALETILLRAIAYRELGIRRALLLRKIDWQKSTAAFESILARDSSFSDVLFQYGLLQKYKTNFEEGIELLHRQQTINPPQDYVEAALFHTYRYFISEKSPSDVKLWLNDHPSDYSRYISGELSRIEGSTETAKSLFSALLESNPDMPPQPILLSLARIYYGTGNPEVAQRYVYGAIDRIEHAVHARMVFEDLKYMFLDEEVERFKRITKGEDFQSFFRNMLARRNPTRADEVDVRLEVHYERLLEAERIYAQYAPREAFRVIKRTESFQTIDRDFPEAYWLNGELGDRGLIYVRHGKPDDTASSVSADTPFIESWRYFNPDLVFHFEGHSGLGVLIPTLPLDLDVLEAREVWGGPYALLSQSLRRRSLNRGTNLARSTDLDIVSFNNELFDESLKDVNEGLSTDRFVWPGDFSHLDLAYMVSSFRGEDNKTSVDVHFALPIGRVAGEMGRQGGRVEMEVGFTVHDTLWNTIHKELTARQAPLMDDPEASAIDLIHFDAPPDTYNVNLHVGIDEALRKGSYLFGYRVPEFRPGDFAISDIIPAVQVTPTTQTGRYIKNGLRVQANPGRGFRKGDPMYVYFEIYNLRFSSGDRTDYTVQYTLDTHSESNRRRLFGRKNSTALSVSFDREGQEASPVEYGELDVSSVRNGVYDLTVTVTDNATGESTSTYRIIELAN